MSLFRAERPSVNRVHFEPTVLGTPGDVSGGTSSGPSVGDVWYDSNTNTWLGVNLGGVAAFGIGAQATPLVSAAVTATNPSATAANLMTYTFQPGVLNAAGVVYHMFAAGTYTTASGQTPTITFLLTAYDGTNTRTLDTWVSGATTASSTTLAWNIDANIVTQAVGATGTLYAHGNLAITLGGTAGAAATVYNDKSTAVSSALKLNSANTSGIVLAINVQTSTSNSGNSVLQDMMIVNSI